MDIVIGAFIAGVVFMLGCIVVGKILANVFCGRVPGGRK